MAVEMQEQGLQNFVVDVGSRVRSLEGRYNLLRDRVLVINNNMITEYKKVLGELRVVNTELKEIKTDIFRLKETIKHLIAEVNTYARREDVKVLEKYINLWNPMKFVSESEVRKMIAEALRKHSEINQKKE